MEKFEVLLSDKKSKKDEEKLDSEKPAKEEIFELEEATQLKKEISEISQGRSLEDLEIPDLKQVLKKYKKMENVLGIASDKKLGEMVQEQMDTAKEIMGEEFFGFHEVKKAFGIEINPEDIPKIPFKEAELERAKELNQFLVLRVDKASDGEPLSLQKINKILKGKLADGSELLSSSDGKGGLKSDSWYRDEKFSKEEVPGLAWALVGKEVIPNSTSKNYLQQTEELVNYIKNSVFKGVEIPGEYQKAIKEFEKEKDEIEKIIISHWKEVAKKLSNFKINRLTRQNSAEVLYDITIYFQNKGEKILENQCSWANSLSSRGDFVGVGGFDSSDVYIDRWGVDDADDFLGVSFSRSC